MSDEFAETDEWPAPEGWMRHQAETGLEPHRNASCDCRGMDEKPGCDHGQTRSATLSPADNRIEWRDRGARIAALEAENAQLRTQLRLLNEGNQS